MVSHTDSYAAFKQAVKQAGSQTKLASICQCTQGNISQLLKAGRLLPGEYVLAVEAATGISRHELRPDLYPVEPSPVLVTPARGGPATAQPGRSSNLHPGALVR